MSERSSQSGTQRSWGGRSRATSDMSGGSSAASDTGSEDLSEAEEELKHVEELLKKEAEAEAGNKTKIKMGTRAVDAIEEKWGSIVAQAVQQVLSSCGDHVLEASIFGIPEKMTLRDACSNSRSALWCAILVASDKVPPYSTFSQAVVLLVEHHEDGSISRGFMINGRPRA